MRATGLLRARFAIRGVDAVTGLLLLMGLVAFTLLSAVSAAWIYPNEERGTYVESMSVVGVLLPLTILSRVLDEGLPSVVVTAKRPLMIERLGWALGYGVVVTTGVAGFGALAGLPWEHFARASVLMVGVTLVGAAIWGVHSAWVGPAVLVAVLSAPKVVPLRANLLYSLGLEDELTLTAGGLLVVGLTIYGIKGSARRVAARAGDGESSG